MAGGSFKQEEIAQLFVQIMARVVKIERQLGIATRVAEVEAAEPNENTTDGYAFSASKYYTVKCTTPDTGNMCFSSKVVVPTDSSSKFTLSNTFTAVITVDVPDGLAVPQPGQIVGAFFAGAYAVGRARYVLYGAGSGSFQCRVNSKFGDYLAVTKIASGTLTGTLFSVALPYSLRQTPFNGATISGVTRAYSTNGTRVASNSSFGQVEAIVPSFNLGVDLIYVTAVDHSDVFVSSEELKFVDLNVDGRVWTSGE